MSTIKKWLSAVLAVILAVSPVVCFAYVSGNGVTSVKTPTSAETATLLWSKQFGTTYKDAPSTMTVVDDTVLVMSRTTLYKLDAANGKVLGQAEMAAAPNFGYTAPTYADGMVFCPLDNGTIQAFQYKKMKSLWVYTDPLGGESLTAITYHDGCIYTGFWNNEDEYANFVCIDVKDENTRQTHEAKTAKWTYRSLGGFYWAGCAFSGDCVIFGTDDGTVYADRPSHLLSLQTANGKKKDDLSIVGDQRSGITVSGNAMYFTTKGGYLYRVEVQDGTFQKSGVKRLSLGGQSTSTPVLWNQRLYVGVQGNSLHAGSLKVINASTMTLIYTASANGYPQNAVLVSDAYAEETGKVYIYTTYNAMPGGITVYTDSASQTKAKQAALFTPEGAQTGYSLSSIVCDEDGTLFYKNDSGYIFAIGNTELQKKDSWLTRFFRSIASFFKRLFSR